MSIDKCQWGTEVVGTIRQVSNYLTSQPQQLTCIVDITNGTNPQDMDFVDQDTWGTEAAGTITKILEYLKTQDLDAECIASVIE